MKKLCAAVILFALAAVFTAVWFSPLVALGAPQIYDNNNAIARADGLCYGANDVVRVEFAGGADELDAALARIGAVTVKTVRTDCVTVVYAYSARVAAKSLYDCDGNEYNVMAAYGDGTVKLGTPILQGCF